MKRTKSRRPWTAAGLLLAFSVAAGLIGATGPLPRGGFDQYTVVGAIENLRKPTVPPELPPILADRRTDEMGE